MPSSSCASRSAVASSDSSPSSQRPPGSPTCPDHGSSGCSARRASSTASSCRQTSTAASIGAPSSSGDGTPPSASASTASDGNGGGRTPGSMHAGKWHSRKCHSRATARAARPAEPDPGPRAAPHSPRGIARTYSAPGMRRAQPGRRAGCSRIGPGRTRSDGTSGRPACRQPVLGPAAALPAVACEATVPGGVPAARGAAGGGVDGQVPRAEQSRTVSGPEGSSTQRSCSGDAVRPGTSRRPSSR